MKPECEVCGEPDLASKVELTKVGLREFPDTDVHRGLLTCRRCREVEAGLIATELQARAALELLKEEGPADLSATLADAEFQERARKRWDRRRVPNRLLTA